MQGVSGEVDSCPKRMQLGPCGGVRPNGDCEMVARACVFPSVAQWTAAPARPNRTPIPRVLSDFTAVPFDPHSIAAIAAVLAPSCDAVLVGEHSNRPDFPPTMLARMLLDAGVTPWMTLACRDRNRVVIEQELRGLRHLGVRTVLCVTGDGRGYDVRPDVTQVFDLDGPRLAHLATTVGLAAAVPETITAPPAHERPFRLLQKQRAGAAIGVLNHAAEPHAVAEFIVAARRIEVVIPIIGAVALITDPISAAILDGLPGPSLDAEVTNRILSAEDPVEAGIAAAVEEAAYLFERAGVDGVNLSGLASGRGLAFAAEVKAETARRIGDLIRD